MGRENLERARKEVGLTQGQLAGEMKIRTATVSDWETGKAEPYPHQYPIIRGILKSKDPYLFNTSESIMDKIRRNILELLALVGITVIPGSTDLVLESIPVILAPDQAFAQCSAAIDACWTLRQYGEYNKASKLLERNMPTLTQLASTPNSHQKLAAGLMVQAKIMLIQRATGKLDFASRESHCVEAVRFGKLSGNPFALVVAQSWQGDTFIYCYRQPETAIEILNDALSGLTKDAMLGRSSIYNKLAIAYSQQGNETKAREYMDMARATMPTYPELDPFYRCLSGHAELDQFEGKMYLHLAEHYPGSDYAQMAYNLFNLSIGKQARSESYQGLALIRKADAARAINQMGEFITSVREGLLIMSSPKRMSEIHEIMGRIPEEWQKEGQIQDLQKDLQQKLSQVKLIKA